MSRQSNAGIVTLEGDAVPSWGEDAGRILDVLAGYHPGDLQYKDITPLSDELNQVMRQDLLSVSPRLTDFVGRLLVATTHSCGVVVPSLGLKHLNQNTRSLMAYALGVCLGNPTATDRRQRQVIWDVKPRARDSGYFSTFSETDREAEFHTDTQYYPMPERHFLLYSIESAKCGGGLSKILDARALRAELDLPEHRWLTKILTEALLPFRVPSAFVTVDEPDVVQATLAPVLSDRPYIRYRRDTLLEGWKQFPEYADPEVIRAIETFDAMLLNCRYQDEFFLKSDGLMLVDNHHSLHARSAFEDQTRHLLRIRVRGPVSEEASATHKLISRTQVSVY